MGCIGSSATYGIEPQACESAYEALKEKYGCDVLIMGIKDQNIPGKLCLAGNVEAALVEAITNILKAHPDNEKVVVQKDEYDMMWNTVWRNTVITSGCQMFSFAKKYFPKTHLFVQLLDAFASFGWGLAAAPNFGGVESRDDKGNVTSCVDWPVLVFYKEGSESIFTNSHMMFAVKDSNIPGKLCASGPIGEMEAAMTEALPGSSSQKDDYDKDHDVVWRDTSITSGASVMSFAKAYFPKGKTNVAILNCAYSFGWRAVAAPNFGGSGDSWPCTIFRKLKDTSGPAPDILFASIKDSNIPGKLCFAGKDADRATDAVCGGLAKLPGNDQVKSEVDSYDNDYDAVCRNINITTGMAAFSLKLPYFPRCDTMTTVLNILKTENYQVVACPNFGGMLDSWPTFIFEKQEGVTEQMFLAVKDENYPGKLCLGGGAITSDPSLATELLDVLNNLSGPQVVQTKDDYDATFDYCYKNTKVTTGVACCSWQKPYWPHGFVVAMVLQVLLKHGWRCEGGPNFGDNGLSWPGMIFSKTAPATE